MAGRLIQGRGIAGNSSHVASSSAGGPVSVVLSIGTTTGNKRWHLQELVWSINATPSSNAITIYEGTSSGTAILKFEVGSSGHDALFLPPLAAIKNTDVTVVLSSASTGGVYLNVLAYEDD